jgi:hypothetical protein
MSGRECITMVVVFVNSDDFRHPEKTRAREPGPRLNLSRHGGRGEPIATTCWRATARAEPPGVAPRPQGRIQASVRRRPAGRRSCRLVRERLAERYAAELNLWTALGSPTPPSGGANRPIRLRAASVRGRTLAENPDLLLGWPGTSTPASIPAGSPPTAREVVQVHPAE